MRDIMRTFNDYVKLKEDSTREAGLGSMGKPSLGSDQTDPMAALFKISKLAWNRGREELLATFGKMAAHDHEMKAALEELVDDKAAVSNAVRKAAGLDSLDDEMDKDEITPNDADKNTGGGGEDDD